MEILVVLAPHIGGQQPNALPRPVDVDRRMHAQTGVQQQLRIRPQLPDRTADGLRKPGLTHSSAIRVAIFASPQAAARARPQQATPHQPGWAAAHPR
ncbi:hypothetical protein AB0H23_32645 [Streptomyces albogriseolus]|uniref:hypothetical protein n=1 Tax=Streptomyces albogriseolus TaxID=1887 RepID=UPI00345F94CE